MHRGFPLALLLAVVASAFQRASASFSCGAADALVELDGSSACSAAANRLDSAVLQFREEPTDFYCVRSGCVCARAVVAAA